MKASALASTLRSCGSVMPIWIEGPPGIGKSRIVHQWAKEVGGLIDLRACLLESVDIRGLPRIGKDSAEWIPPDFLPREGKDSPTGVLFLDELGQAPIPTQNALLQLSLDRTVGTHYKLPPGWIIVAASNRLEDRAGVNRTTSALNARFMHLSLQVDTDDWLAWAVQNDVNWEIRSYIQFRPNMLHKFDGKSDEKSHPNPRSWEFVSKIMAANPDPKAELDIFSGIVGRGAASEFQAHRKIYTKLPNIEDLLFKNAPVPTEPSIKYAIIGGAVDYLKTKAVGKDKKKVTEAVCAFMPKLGVEFAVAAYKQVTAVDNTIFLEAGPARDFMVKHRALFIG